MIFSHCRNAIFLTTLSTTSAGVGLSLMIVRLDYRYIWVEHTRRGINRAYVGLEFELGNWP